MEAGMTGGEAVQDPNAYIREQFHIPQSDLRSYSPLALAYIGDGIYELVIRTVILGKGGRPVNQMHRMSSHFAKARAQSEMVEILLPHMTEQEKQIYHRGRNAKSYTKAKNASVNDYRRATGLEAVMGYLYLSGQFPRLVELVKTAVDTYKPDESRDSEARNEMSSDGFS